LERRAVEEKIRREAERVAQEKERQANEGIHVIAMFAIIYFACSSSSTYVVGRTTKECRCCFESSSRETMYEYNLHF
jgi:hypothetical protein